MTTSRYLITSMNQRLDLPCDDSRIVDHFSTASNYADIVLNMFNTDRFYDQFFAGWQDITVLDIGANIGLFSLYIQDRARKVYALEPTPNHYDILCEMTKKFTNIMPLKLALHSDNAVVDFFLSKENSTMNSTVNHYADKITAQGITLPSLLDHLQLEAVDFVKCDIEGSEMQALNNQILESVRNKITVWSLEVHETASNSLHANREILAAIFESHGYKTYNHRYDCLYAYR